MVVQTVANLPDAPDRGDGGTQFDIDAAAWAAALALWTTQVNALGLDVNSKHAEILAIALAGDLPALTGHSLKMLRVNVGETAVEFVEFAIATTGVAGPILKATPAEALAGTELDRYADVVDMKKAIEDSGLSGKLLHVRDEKANGVGGGSSAVGVQTRVLNTVVSNDIVGASLAANQITLPSGTYYVAGHAPVYSGVNGNSAFFANITDGVTALLGTTHYCPVGMENQSSFVGKFTIPTAKVFALKHTCESVVATWGLGRPATRGVVEIYGSLEVWRVS